MLETILLANTKDISTTTFSPTLKQASVSLSNGNLTANCGNAGGGVFGTAPQSAGNWYFEIQSMEVEGGIYGPIIGLASSSTPLASGWTKTNGGIFWYCSDTANTIIYGNNARFAYGLSSVRQGDIVGLALDMNAKTLFFSKNGVAQGLISIPLYSAATVFYPFVTSPSGLVDATVVDWIRRPQFRPAGYNAW